MLLAIVSQNSLVLVFVGGGGDRTIIVRYVAKWCIAQMCLCETKYQGGVSHHFGGMLISLKKYRVIWGIAAIVSQYLAIWSSRNKLPFMILNPRSKVQKNAFSCRKIHFPTEKCIFLPKNAHSCGKMPPAEKCGFGGAHGRKLQEIAGGLRGSRIKKASQLSQDMGPLRT